MNWRLEEEAVKAAEAAGMRTIRLSSGNSPYSDFQLLAVPADGWDCDVPHHFEVSEVQLKTVDPSTSYKGRHGSGVLILVTPDPDGWVKVLSNSNDAVFILLDGTHLGKPPKRGVTLGDFFKDIQK